jgi:hypothetical protein
LRAIIFIEELIDSGEFLKRVQALTGDFRKKFALPEIHQLGLVVTDMAKAATDLEAKGIGPFFLAQGSPVIWHERGQARKFSGGLGLAYFQGFELELLELGQGSDFYRRSLDPGGKIVIQHLGFLVDDVDEWADKLVKQGYPVYVRGRIKTGPLNTEFAYMDTEADAGLVIEFICWRFFGVRISPFPALVHTLGRLEKWSGKRMIKT